jgi:hypothetical protein
MIDDILGEIGEIEGEVKGKVLNDDFDLESIESLDL